MAIGWRSSPRGNGADSPFSGCLSLKLYVFSHNFGASAALLWQICNIDGRPIRRYNSTIKSKAHFILAKGGQSPCSVSLLKK